MINWYLTRVPTQFNTKKKLSFQQMGLDNWITTCKRMKLETYIIPYIKVNLKYILDQHIRVKIIKL